MCDVISGLAFRTSDRVYWCSLCVSSWTDCSKKATADYFRENGKHFSRGWGKRNWRQGKQGGIYFGHARHYWDYSQLGCYHLRVHLHNAVNYSAAVQNFRMLYAKIFSLETHITDCQKDHRHLRLYGQHKVRRQRPQRPKTISSLPSVSEDIVKNYCL